MITGAEHPALVGPVGAARQGRQRDPRNVRCAICRSVMVGPPLTVCETCEDERPRQEAPKGANGVAEAKRLLPLRQLMERLGYRDHAKDSARCPFHHPDRNPSFGTFQREGQWFWKCQAGCGHGDEITFLEKTQGLSRTEATKAFLRMAGVAVVGASANGATFTPRERNATLAVAQPAPASPQVNAASSKRSNEVNAVSTVVSRISEEKHLPNTYPTPTSHLPQHQPNTYSIPAAMLASAYEEKIASERIKSEGRDGQINYQDWLKQLTREEKLVYRAFKSKARASGFRVIWGMARRHAKVGNKWFPIKDSYLREKLGYRDKSSIYDLIETLRDLEVLAPHPGNGHGLDYNLYRWSLPTNIWEMDNGTCGDDDEMPF